MATFKDEKVREAFRKKLYPIISPDASIGEVADYWMSTDTEIIDKMPETIKQVVGSKQRCQNMLIQAMGLLHNPYGAIVDMTMDTIENDPLQISLLARNKYIRSVETALTFIKVIAGQKAENVEQAKKRLMSDSAK